MHCKGKTPSTRTSQQQQWLVYGDTRYLVRLWTLDEPVFCRVKQHSTTTPVQTHLRETEASKMRA